MCLEVTSVQYLHIETNVLRSDKCSVSTYKTNVLRSDKCSVSMYKTNVLRSDKCSVSTFYRFLRLYDLLHLPKRLSD